MPSASTVASVMAVGSRGSAAMASVSQAANSAKGSSAAVKSPLVNHVGCSIGAVSAIFGSSHVVGSETHRLTLRLYNRCGGLSLWHGLASALALVAGLGLGG